MIMNTIISNRNNNSISDLGIDLPDPFESISRKQIDTWLNSHVGVYYDDSLAEYRDTLTERFLNSLFLEGCTEAREFGFPKDGSRYFWTIHGRLVRLYSKSLIKALRSRIKEAEKALDKLHKSPEFKTALAKLCGITSQLGFDERSLLEAEFVFMNKKGQRKLHFLYEIYDYILALPSWVDNYIYLQREYNKITR